ncbi:MAG: sigma-54 dependent transcriptional regulator [Candidatus Aminicenantes bacterium]|nr:sigma-54 dependent transcriptional regulator [Candidatus Aminicenantes bacterium]MDH5743697.1 sigma-54 dependent transcriptional regulator [Candidatus Aminicenantes bacterium]
MIKDKILVIDDEAGIRSSLKGILEDEGYVVTTTDTGEKGLDLLKGENFDLVLLDIWLPQMSGLDVLEKIKRSEESSQVVMISGHGSIATAVKATKLGAYDFLEKPLTLEKVILTAKNALHQKMLEEENIQLRARIEAKYHLIGESPAIQKLKNEIKLAAPTNGRVLIYGETGTGKELVARLLHQQSPRRDKRFIQINSAAIPDYLIESELFGYAGEDKPGPEKRKKGKILLADGGSLFLDEIGDMSLKTQVKLVRFIEEETFKPLDSSESTTSDVRLIASTTKNLRELIAQGKFREDLFFKLNIIPMAIPPLRERKEDISLLIEYFLSYFAKEYGKKQKRMKEEALQAFINYSWPGNVSELINVIERFVIMVKEKEIESSHLSLLVEPMESQFISTVEESKPLRQAKEQFEREYIHKILLRHHWDIPKTASELNIEEDLLHEKIKSLGISFLG